MIGVIGQGFVGKPLADYLERDNTVVRYSLSPEHQQNSERLKDCTVVFICVPTPTRRGQQDLSAVRESLSLCTKIAVIKCTVLPGTCRLLAKEFPNLSILHAPEFLRERTAEHDTLNPDRNVIGGDEPHCSLVLKLLPRAAVYKLVSWETAETIKYANNLFLTMKVLYANLIHDYSKKRKADPDSVLDVVGADPRIGHSHLTVNDNGRGAGGRCFIKDLSAFRTSYLAVEDLGGDLFFGALEARNKQYLLDCGKDVDILSDVFGAQKATPSVRVEGQGTAVQRKGSLPSRRNRSPKRKRKYKHSI
jgi:UDP-glucose 6-dehydrogenase